ncbi:uncharacterized protein [Nicotiana sylvestris]|uniref:uncharacterized protein n=1 Tax=Nicotiana sylvestris TaxID=4096 RepID=UPI00388C3535
MRDDIQLLTRLVAVQARHQEVGIGHADRSVSAKVHDFINLDPPVFTRAHLDEDPQAILLHQQAFAKYRAELTRYEVELEKLVEEMDKLKILYIKKEGEISDLRAVLAKARQEQTELIEKAQQKGELVEQLREELKMKKAETLGLKQHMDRLALEKDTLQEHLTSIEHQLQRIKEESLSRSRKIEELEAKSVVELAKAKSDAEAFVSSYQDDAEDANTRAKDISAAAEFKLLCSLDHARRQSWRETLEEVHARGFNLSVNIEKAKTLEEEAAALLFDDEDSASGSESGGDGD